MDDIESSLASACRRDLARSQQNRFPFKNDEQHSYAQESKAALVHRPKATLVHWPKAALGHWPKAALVLYCCCRGGLFRSAWFSSSLGEIISRIHPTMSKPSFFDPYVWAISLNRYRIRYHFSIDAKVRLRTCGSGEFQCHSMQYSFIR